VSCCEQLGITCFYFSLQFPLIYLFIFCLFGIVIVFIGLCVGGAVEALEFDVSELLLMVCP
jgi:hypothetical protein